MEKAKGILSTLGYKNLPSGEIIMAKEKKALLLGSSGALGTYLAPALVKMGYKVDVSPFPKQKIRSDSAQVAEWRSLSISSFIAESFSM